MSMLAQNNMLMDFLKDKVSEEDMQELQTRFSSTKKPVGRPPKDATWDGMQYIRNGAPISPMVKSNKPAGRPPKIQPKIKSVRPAGRPPKNATWDDLTKQYVRNNEAMQIKAKTDKPVGRPPKDATWDERTKRYLRDGQPIIAKKKTAVADPLKYTFDDDGLKIFSRPRGKGKTGCEWDYYKGVWVIMGFATTREDALKMEEYSSTDEDDEEEAVEEEVVEAPPIDNALVVENVIHNALVVEHIDDEESDDVINNEPVVDEPIDETVVDEPLNETVVDEPIDETAVDEPLNETVVDEPLNETVVDEPIDKPVQKINRKRKAEIIPRENPKRQKSGLISRFVEVI